jgi:hypothetical protein
MTLCGQMDPPQRIDETLSIFNVTGGWARGSAALQRILQLGGQLPFSRPGADVPVSDRPTPTRGFIPSVTTPRH